MAAANADGVDVCACCACCACMAAAACARACSYEPNRSCAEPAAPSPAPLSPNRLRPRMEDANADVGLAD
eukprot:CAMPEP_0119203354 /NCGR_PEP_ID=MMETSP1316-20130426/34430_1 /TAXON_ID=41880 /ORGANISM="Pycnococcus provasolii, Strain RCC2336" /LENGTH=69 /DNA_ID=CAMNT_0007199601 /DNA_START=13 /DNA_END=222 /DNA_ORIENTATION=+